MRKGKTLIHATYLLFATYIVCVPGPTFARDVGYTPYVTSERPEGVRLPQEISASSAAAGPVVDGAATDAAWLGTNQFTVSLSREESMLDISVRSIVTESHIYFLLVWADESKSTTHRRWLWRDGEYKESPEREDGVMIRFSVGCDFVASLDAGLGYDCDVWYWGAARTDPIAYAADMSIFIDTRILKSNERTQVFRLNVEKQEPFWRVHQGFKGTASPLFFFERPRPEVSVALTHDVGNMVYRRIERPSTFSKPTVEQFVPQQPSRSGADIRARGIWHDGYWTVEMARLKTTEFMSDDWSVEPLVTMGIAIYDGTEFPDEYVSETLFFRTPVLKVAASD